MSYASLMVYVNVDLVRSTWFASQQASQTNSRQG